MVLFPISSIFAQEGPSIPCVGCDQIDRVPFPEPGLWYNPDQSGSGFNLEFQNGHMAGFYYSYDPEGNPEWLMLNQALVRSETPGVMWEVEVQPERYSGGNCPTCAYHPPGAPEYQQPIRIEFLQRAYARLTLHDGSVQFLVPIMYGTSGKAYFSEHTPHLFPEFLPIPRPTEWVVAIRLGSEDDYAPWDWRSGILIIAEASFHTDDSNVQLLHYGLLIPSNPPEGAVVIGRIECTVDPDMHAPSCALYLGEWPEFRIPIANITDSRISGENALGDSIEMFRLRYD
jgi:hypothetical protein